MRLLLLKLVLHSSSRAPTSSFRTRSWRRAARSRTLARPMTLRKGPMPGSSSDGFRARLGLRWIFTKDYIRISYRTQDWEYIRTKIYPNLVDYRVSNSIPHFSWPSTKRACQRTSSRRSGGSPSRSPTGGRSGKNPSPAADRGVIHKQKNLLKNLLKWNFNSETCSNYSISPSFYSVAHPVVN